MLYPRECAWCFCQKLVPLQISVAVEMRYMLIEMLAYITQEQQP